jgi:DNA-binding MarR family transcriptional regulator
MAGAGAKRSKAKGARIAQYEVLAAFRARLREFLAFSDSVSARAGITQQQYQALLALRAHAPARPLSIRGLAALLLIKHHSAVGMVDRLEKQGLVRREASFSDRRVVAVRLTAHGARTIDKLSAVHRGELRRIAPAFRRIMSFLAKPDPE